MKRIIAGGLGALFAANAVAMLAASLWWFSAVPGAVMTGPFNAHFVHDVGATYLVVAGGLGWFAWRPGQGWPALVVASAFLLLHGLIHLHDAILSPTCSQDLLRDLPGVFAPGLISAWIALTSIPSQRKP